MNRAFLLLVWLCPASLFAAVNWAEILGPSQAEIPLPLGSVVWRHELMPALAEARRDNKPLFVTWRCLPCKQCSAFDKDVLEGGDILPGFTQSVREIFAEAKR